MTEGRLSDEDIAEMRKLHDDGISCRKIAGRFFVDPSYVSRVVRKLNRKDVRDESADGDWRS